MKFLRKTLPLLCALPLAIAANPIVQQGAQQALARPNSLSPANSFASASDVESASSKSSKSSKFSLSNILRPAKTFSASGAVGEYKCQSYPQATLLAELAAYVTNLLKNSRDEILFDGNKANSGSIFETCYAGYAADDVSPAIYFGRLAKKQAKAIEKLLRNSVVAKFPGTDVVTNKATVALVAVHTEKTGLKRRNTV